jgi:transcriptional regulator with XRE-family HTH domain
MSDTEPLSDEDRATLLEVGRRVRRARDSARQTQQQTADGAGLQRSYLAGVERGQRNPSIPTMARIANALEVDLGDLLSS